MVGEKDIAGKKCGLIACCEEHDAAVMEGILFPYKHTVELIKWKSVGEVLVPGVFHPGDVKNTDGLRKAAALAEAF